MLARLAQGVVFTALATCVMLTSSTVVTDVSPARSAIVGESGPVTINLDAAPAAAGIVRSAQPLSVRVTVTNTGNVATGTISLALDVDGGQPVSSAQLADWFEADSSETSGSAKDESGAGGAADTIAEATVSSLDPGASAVLDLIVSADTPALSGEFGARLALVRAMVSGDGGSVTVIDRTALVWAPDGALPPVTATTFVAAITTPAESAAFLSADALDRYTAEAGALTRTLDAVAGRPVLMAIDPRILASIRILGDQAPTSAVAFLDRLSRAPNESFLLPWADADPVATLTAASTALPTREGSGLVRPSGDGAQPTESPGPTAAPEQTSSLEELTQWPATFEGWNWVGKQSLTTEAITALGEQGSNVLIVPGSSLGQNAPVQTLGDVLIVRADDAIAQAAQGASLAESQQQFDRSLARLSALLAASAQRAPGVPTVITLSRDQLASTDRIIDTIAQTVSLPWVNSAEASAALEVGSVAGTVVAAEVDASRSDAVLAALNAEVADRVFATIALTPEAITDIRRLELLSSLSQGWGERSIDALRAFVADSLALRASVQVVQSSDITLLADRASLPVTVQNQLDVAVRVFVHVDPDTAQLQVVDDNIETLVEPRSQTRALVPVESLTNGQVGITVSVLDESARTVGEPTRVSLNLQAGWETAGTIAVAIAVLLLFTVGIARDIRKRRQRRKESATP